jgi:hypothetical protein
MGATVQQYIIALGTAKYDSMTCHQQCQEDRECVGFDVNTEGVCNLYDKGACTKSTVPVENTRYYTKSGFREKARLTDGVCTHPRAHELKGGQVANCKEYITHDTCIENSGANLNDNQVVF